MSEALRLLERRAAADPSDLVVLRRFADERKRRGAELLPARREPAPYACETLRLALRGDWVSVRLRTLRRDFWETYRTTATDMALRFDTIMRLAVSP